MYIISSVKSMGAGKFNLNSSPKSNLVSYQCCASPKGIWGTDKVFY